ncbi:MAG: Siroheme synthase [bacterium]|nr:Siroheme synthase [bacterium]
MWVRSESNMSQSRSGDSRGGGFVSLIGAGPGDPRLITCLGFSRLAGCDVVVHDRLIPLALLDEVPPTAERVDVGKSPGHDGIQQPEINRILIEKASAGLRVARLKGGDPAVFGRVGEEACALADAGVPFEIIPGVTAASAAAASLGIPLTHRGLASSVTFATIHEDPSKPNSQIDWNALAHSGTLAFYMAGGRTAEAARRLIAGGMSPECPTAIILTASAPEERILEGTLAGLAQGIGSPEKGIPFVLLVGEVLSLAAPRERRLPLLGRRIAITHPPTPPSDPLREELPLLGAHLLDCPCIAILPPEEDSAIREAAREIGTYDWVLFTSKNAVDFFFQRLFEEGLDSRAFGSCRIGVVGDATSRRLSEFSLFPDLIPAEATGRALAKALIEQGKVRGGRFLLPCSEIAREELAGQLSEAGGLVDRVIAYRTVAHAGEWSAEEQLRSGAVDAITFASPSALKGFRERLGAEMASRLLRSSKVFSIGPTTAAALQAMGIEAIHEAKTASLAGILESILEVFRTDSTQGVSNG